MRRKRVGCAACMRVDGFSDTMAGVSDRQSPRAGFVWDPLVVVWCVVLLLLLMSVLPSRQSMEYVLSCNAARYYGGLRIENRTYGTHNNRCIYLFLPTIFGPINSGPPVHGMPLLHHAELNQQISRHLFYHCCYFSVVFIVGVIVLVVSRRSYYYLVVIPLDLPSDAFSWRLFRSHDYTIRTYT